MLKMVLKLLSWFSMLWLGFLSYCRAQEGKDYFLKHEIYQEKQNLKCHVRQKEREKPSESGTKRLKIFSSVKYIDQSVLSDW